MLSVATGPARTRLAALVGAVCGLGACSVLPPANYPAFADHLLSADFVVPAEGRLRLPVTTRDLVVHELVATPPPLQEQFGSDGERWYLYPAGAEVHVRCRCRIYVPRDGAPLPPAQLLPGAHHLEVQSSP